MAFRDTGGTGLLGTGSRAGAVYEWAHANSGRSLCAHAHSSGSGRLMTWLTRFDTGDMFDTVTFDGGPVFAYSPWVCGTTTGDQPLGSPPDWFVTGNDGGNQFTNAIQDCAHTPGSNQSACSARPCRDHTVDDVLLKDSNLLRSDGHSLDGIDLHVVLGGSDDSSASRVVMLYLRGYSHGGSTWDPFTADSIDIVQGYCSSTAGTYAMGSHTLDCGLWDSGLFPGVERDTQYDPRLIGVDHSTTRFEGGMEVVLEQSLSTCEL